MGGLFGKPEYVKCCCDGNPCCPDRCNTVNGEECDNPLPLTLTATLTVVQTKLDPRTGIATGCYSVTGTLNLSALNGWIGVVSGTCTNWCTDDNIVFEYEVRVTCGLQDNGQISWHVDVRDNLGGNAARKCTNNNTPIVEANLTSSCDPIMLTGRTNTFVCTDLTCVIPLEGIDEEFGEVSFDVLITEDP